MATIKNLIFDLGNVIIPLEQQKCIDAFNVFAEKPLEVSFFQDPIVCDIIARHEVSAISDEEFVEELKKYGNLTATHQQTEQAWNSMLGVIPIQRFTLLEKLKQHYSLYLLSNTNYPHQLVFEKQIQEQTGKPWISFFNTIYYSHVIKLRKPTTECFQFVLNDADIKADETLFIDDNLPNIEAARKMKINSLHLPDFNNLDRGLKNFIVY